MRITIRKKITGMSIILGIIVGLCSSLVTYKLTGDDLINLSKENAKQIACIAASQINGEKHESIKVGDEGTEEYQEILHIISNVKEHSGLEYIYTMALDDTGTLRFIVDEDQEEGATIGVEYELLDDMLPALQKGEASCDRDVTTDEWGSCYSAYAPIYHEDRIVGIVGCDVSTEEINEKLNELSEVMVIMGIISAFICGLGGYFISRAITINLNKLKHKVKDIAQNDGDLTEEIKLTTNDELKDIANEMNAFIAQIRAIVISITEVTAEIVNGGNGIENGAKQVSKQIADISDSMETLSASMEEYSASAEVSQASLSRTKESIENIAEKVEHYYEQTKLMSKNSHEAVKLIQTEKQAVSDEVAEIENRVNEAIAESKSIKQISALADNIVGISNQTRLLALNASIEAARAGEQGRGFAVVAEEINKLSGGINETATNIQELSKTLIGTVERLAQNAGDMSRYVNVKILQDYDGFLENSESYKKSTEDIHEIMQYFTEQIMEIKSDMDNVAMAISEINQTIGSDTEEITRVNSDVSDMKSYMEGQSALALKNNEYADKLVHSVSRFKV